MRLSRVGMWLVLAGIAVVGGYALLRLGHVGKFGAPTDIGGGLLALTGFGLLLAGLVVSVVALVERRRR